MLLLFVCVIDVLDMKIFFEFEINSNAWVWHVDGEENRQEAINALTNYENDIQYLLVNSDGLTRSWLATYPLER